MTVLVSISTASFLADHSDTRNNISAIVGKMTSLQFSPVVPRCTGFLFPILCFACMTVFIVANMHVGTTIEGTARIGKYRTPRWTVFEFSIWTSIDDMWKAHTYFLAALIAVWSGAWPYVKTFCLAVGWMLPQRFLSLKRRRKLLTIWLILAKWALCDIFLLVFFDVAFRFHISLSSAPFIKRLLPLDFVTADLVVNPEVASYAFITSTVVVIFLINAAEYYHRNDLAYQSHQTPVGRRGKSRHDLGWFRWVRCPRRSWFERGTEEVDDDVHFISNRVNPWAKESISSHHFDMHTASFSVGLMVNSRGNMSRMTMIALIMLLACTVAVILLGAWVDSFSFKFKALAGIALEALDPGSEVRRYSFFKLLADLSAKSVVLDDEHLTTSLFLGVTYMQSVTILFSLVFPFVQIFLLGVLMLVPLNLRDQKIMFYISSLVGSVSSLDVFAVSVIIAVTQLEQFSLFLQGEKCDWIVDNFHLDCFRVKTELLPGSWMLFFAAVFLFAVARLVSGLCERVMLERELRCLSAASATDEEHQDDNASAASFEDVAEAERLLLHS